MTSLSDQLLWTYGKSDRPTPNRDRSVPIQPSKDTRPSSFARLCVGFVIGFGALLFLCRLLLGVAG